MDFMVAIVAHIAPFLHTVHWSYWLLPIYLKSSTLTIFLINLWSEYWVLHYLFHSTFVRMNPYKNVLIYHVTHPNSQILYFKCFSNIHSFNGHLLMPSVQAYTVNPFHILIFIPLTIPALQRFLGSILFISHVPHNTVSYIIAIRENVHQGNLKLFSSIISWIPMSNSAVTISRNHKKGIHLLSRSREIITSN